MIIPIEIHSNFELIHLHEFIILGPKEDIMKYSIKCQFGNIILKSETITKIYRVNNYNFSETFKQCQKQIELTK